MKAKSKLKRNIYISVDGAAASSAGEKVKEKSRGRRGEWSGPPASRVAPLVRHRAVHLVDGRCERAQTHLL